jgi:hypothetical protein
MIKRTKHLISIFALFTIFTILSCKIKVYTLQDKITVVPKNLDVYTNKVKFKQSLLVLIDTASVYEEFNENRLERLNICKSCHQRYLVYKFYPNGCFNIFSFWKDTLPLADKINPNYSGVRGVYYLEDNDIKLDAFSTIGNLHYYGISTRTLKISGDTLFIKITNKNDSNYQTNIYIKRKLPKEYFQYKANW